MYEPGDLQAVTIEELDELFGPPEEGDPPHRVHDARGNITWRPPVLTLPHSCDRWVIGGRAELEAFIADALKALDSFPKGETRRERWEDAQRRLAYWQTIEDHAKAAQDRALADKVHATRESETA